MDVRVLVGVAAIVGAGVSAMMGCAGPDPGLATFTEGAALESTVGTEPEAEEKTAPKTEKPTAGANPTFKADVYPFLKADCAACHAAPGANSAPVFMGADADTTYTAMKAKSYHLANSRLVTRGAHLGRELTAEEKAAVQKWSTAEGGGAGDAGADAAP